MAETAPARQRLSPWWRPVPSWWHSSWWGAVLASTQITSRVVAYSGLPPPGLPQRSSTSFSYLAISSQGEVVFRGRLVGSNANGLWCEARSGGTADMRCLLIRSAV